MPINSRGVNERLRVWNGRMKSTSGGLKKKHLFKDRKTGRIKSRRASRAAKKRWKSKNYKHVREAFLEVQIPKKSRRKSRRRKSKKRSPRKSRRKSRKKCKRYGPLSRHKRVRGHRGQIRSRSCKKRKYKSKRKSRRKSHCKKGALKQHIRYKNKKGKIRYRYCRNSSRK